MADRARLTGGCGSPELAASRRPSRPRGTCFAPGARVSRRSQPALLAPVSLVAPVTLVSVIPPQAFAGRSGLPSRPGGPLGSLTSTRCERQERCRQPMGLVHVRVRLRGWVGVRWRWTEQAPCRRRPRRRSLRVLARPTARTGGPGRGHLVGGQEGEVCGTGDGRLSLFGDGRFGDVTPPEHRGPPLVKHRRAGFGRGRGGQAPRNSEGPMTLVCAIAPMITLQWLGHLLVRRWKVGTREDLWRPVRETWSHGQLVRPLHRLRPVSGVPAVTESIRRRAPGAASLRRMPGWPRRRRAPASPGPPGRRRTR